MADSHPVVLRYRERPLAPHLVAEIEAIFFEASGRTPGPQHEQFRERWLGRYLVDGSDVVLLALGGERAVAGYLVGALEDPASQPRFSDLGYLTVAFRDLCRCYPAHLHVNLAPPFRGRGMGAALVAAFVACAREAGAPGMHVVTRADAPNVGFYQRCGFAEAARCAWDGRELVFLARPL